MNAWFREMTSRFEALEVREQVALSALAAFLLAVIFYLAVWSPANTYLADSQLDHDRDYKLLSYLKSTESEARAAASGSGTRKVTGRSLLTTVSRTAQSAGIKPSRMQPEGDDSVSVWFDAVPFNQLMLWLERLEAQQGVIVRQVSMDRRDQPGQVSARLVLRN